MEHLIHGGNATSISFLPSYGYKLNVNTCRRLIIFLFCVCHFRKWNHTIVIIIIIIKYVTLSPCQSSIDNSKISGVPFTLNTDSLGYPSESAVMWIRNEHLNTRVLLHTVILFCYIQMKSKDSYSVLFFSIVSDHDYTNNRQSIFHVI